MLRSDLCNLSEAYIVVKETITFTGSSDNDRKIVLLHLKITHHLLVSFQKLMTLQCTCTI